MIPEIRGGGGYPKIAISVRTIRRDWQPTTKQKGWERVAPKAHQKAAMRVLKLPNETHCSRSVRMGSILAARSAGTSAAIIETSARTSVTSRNTDRSSGVT